MSKKPANYERRVFSLNKAVSAIRFYEQQRLATGKTNRYSFVFFYTLIVANEINKANLFQGNGDMLLLSVLFKTEEKLYLVPLLNSEWLPPEK